MDRVDLLDPLVFYYRNVYHGKRILNSLTTKFLEILVYSIRQKIADRSSLPALCYSYIIYLNHTNIAWGSTNRINLKRLLTHQKYATQVINNKVRFDHNAELFKSHEMLNIFELKVFNIATFMYKVNSNTAPATFHEFF